VTQTKWSRIEVGEIEAELVLASIFVLDPLIALGVVENSELAMHAAEFVGLLKFKINVLNWNLLIVRKLSDLLFLNRFEVDYIRFEISFEHSCDLPGLVGCLLLVK
jgi:hypothetical protein